MKRCDADQAVFIKSIRSNAAGEALALLLLASRAASPPDLFFFARFLPDPSASFLGAGFGSIVSGAGDGVGTTEGMVPNRDADVALVVAIGSDTFLETTFVFPVSNLNRVTTWHRSHSYAIWSKGTAFLMDAFEGLEVCFLASFFC